VQIRVKGRVSVARLGVLDDNLEARDERRILG
jgi:hypothetical protein